MKLLIQELQSMNIQMRLITEDNINRFDPITFSNNIGKLIKEENANISAKKALYDIKSIIELGAQTPSIDTNDTNNTNNTIHWAPNNELNENGQHTPHTPSNTPPIDDSPTGIVDIHTPQHTPHTPPIYSAHIHTPHSPHTPSNTPPHNTDNSNEITINTVPWGPNNSNSLNLQENKPTVLFQNDDGSIGKAKLQKKEDVINELNSGANLLQKPEDEEKKKDNGDDTESSSNDTKKIITTEP